MDKVFVDTAFLFAFINKYDKYHKKAISLSQQIDDSNTSVITTRAIFLELGNTLSKLKFRNAAIELLSTLEEKPNLEIIPISENLYNRAFQLFKERQDKEWSITDCISFTIMQDENIKDALTTDIHFK